MELRVQRRLAAQALKCSPKRVWFDQTKLSTIKDAITKADVRSLVNSGVIQGKPAKSNSRGRARETARQRVKGRKRGHGRRKGIKTARLNAKDAWMARVRLQREFLKELRAKGYINQRTHRSLYQKSKGGFFRSKRHIKLYIDEHDLAGKQGPAKA